MSLKFDPAKDAINLEKHGISLGRAADMVIQLVIEDDWTNHGERRFRAFGTIDDLAPCLGYTTAKAVVPPSKVPVSTDLSEDVVRFFKARSPDWQSDIYEVLKKAIVR